MLVVIRLSRGLSARTSICKEHAKCDMDQILTVESREHDATVKGRYLWQVKPLKYKKKQHICYDWKLRIFKLTVRRNLGLHRFALLRYVIGPEKLAPLPQPVKLTQITTKAIWFYFEFSLTLKGILLSLDWPLWLLGFLFYDSISNLRLRKSSENHLDHNFMIIQISGWEGCLMFVALYSTLQPSLKLPLSNI